MKKIISHLPYQILIAIALIAIVVLPGCSAYDALAEDAYIEGDLYVYDGSDFVSVNDNLCTPAGVYSATQDSGSIYRDLAGGAEPGVSFSVNQEWIDDYLGGYRFYDTDTVDVDYDDASGRFEWNIIPEIPDSIEYKCGVIQANGSGIADVSFATNMSTSNYIIQLTCQNYTDECFATYSTVTTSGFRIYVYDDGGKAEANVYVSWLVIPFHNP